MIKPKASLPNILPRSTIQYNAETFAQYEAPMFKAVTAEQVLAEINPITFDFLPGQKFIAVDTETFYTGIPNNKMPANVVRRWIHLSSTKSAPNDFPFCISICDGTNSFVVYDTLDNQFNEFRKLEPLLTDTSISKILQNADYDMHMLANARVNMKGRIHDTLFLSKLTRAGAFTHRLVDIANEIHCPTYPTITHFEKMLDSYKAQHRITDYRMFPRELMTQYTGADTWNALWSFAAMYPIAIANEQIQLYDIECETLITTYHMERAGIRLDADYAPILIPELEKEVEEAERKVYESAGSVFNINSSQQLESVLIKMGYGHLINYKQPTEAMYAKGQLTGNPSFDKYEMERLEAEGVPLIVDIQQYKSSLKLLNTFAIKLYELCDANDVVHCNINTIEAKTGRFSISDPSMQNMPRRRDSRVRAAFIPPEGFTFYDFDFKAQESLILVHYSKSQYLMDLLAEGKDIHSAVATLIYSIAYEEVTKALREVSKSVEFAMTYGAGAAKVKAMTGLTLEEASSAMKTFLRNCPEVASFIKTANKVVKERGLVRTILNRHVYTERGREYACVNYIIQGSAADSTKGRMAQIYRFLKANGYKSYMVLQVHDSLLQAIADGEEELLGYLRWLQTERQLFRVTVNVDVGICTPTWREKKDIAVQAVKPPQEMLDKMEAYDIWSEGLFERRGI